MIGKLSENSVSHDMTKSILLELNNYLKSILVHEQMPISEISEMS